MTRRTTGRVELPGCYQARRRPRIVDVDYFCRSDGVGHESDTAAARLGVMCKIRITGALLSLLLAACAGQHADIPSVAAAAPQAAAPANQAAHAPHKHPNCALPCISDPALFATVGGNEIISPKLFVFYPLFGTTASSSQTLSGDRMWYDKYTNNLFMHHTDWTLTGGSGVTVLNSPWTAWPTESIPGSINMDMAFGQRGEAFVLESGQVLEYTAPYTTPVRTVFFPGPSTTAVHVATDKSGNLWIMTATSLLEYAAAGNWSAPVATYTWGPSTTARPMGLALDANDNAFAYFIPVTPGGSGYVREFNSKLALIRTITGLPVSSPDLRYEPIAIDPATSNLLVIGTGGLYAFSSTTAGPAHAVASVNFNAISLQSGSFSVDEFGDVFLPNQANGYYSILEYYAPFTGSPHASQVFPLQNGPSTDAPNYALRAIQ